MRIPIYQIDAFTSQVLKGNPAAVCPLEHWLDDGLLQAIAAENNLWARLSSQRPRGRFSGPRFSPSSIGLAAPCDIRFYRPGLRSLGFSNGSGLIGHGAKHSVAFFKKTASLSISRQKN